MARGNRFGYTQSGYTQSGYGQSGQSQREQLYMEDVLGALRLTSNKYQYYAMQCQDQEIRQLCQHIAQHQQSDLQQIQSLMDQRTGQLQ